MIGRLLIPGLVRPVPVVMPGVGPQDRPQMALAVNQHPVGALGRYRPYPAFGITVRPGRPRRGLHGPYTLAGEDVIERAGELGVAVPDEDRNEPIRPARFMIRLRACRAVHAPSGYWVTPRMCTRRVAVSRTNSTYRRLRKIVSTVKKPQASRPSARARRKVRQEVSRPREAGRYRQVRRIRRTLASLTSWPRRVSSPCTRRYPQAGFLPASRSTSSRISWQVPGRPGRLGQVHLRVTRRRCQASRVPGVTSRLPRSAAGSSRASAARTARSAQSGPGRATWRRSTITSCRSTRISASFDAWLRPSRTSQPNTWTMTKYIRRTDTNRDHASTRPSRQIAGHGPRVEF